MAFGGVKAAADALGVPLTTVSYWNKRGIPAWRLTQVKEIAAKLSVKLPEAA